MKKESTRAFFESATVIWVEFVSASTGKQIIGVNTHVVNIRSTSVAACMQKDPWRVAYFHSEE